MNIYHTAVKGSCILEFNIYRSLKVIQSKKIYNNTYSKIMFYELNNLRKLSIQYMIRCFLELYLNVL